MNHYPAMSVLIARVIIISGLILTLGGVLIHVTWYIPSSPLVLLNLFAMTGVTPDVFLSVTYKALDTIQLISISVISLFLYVSCQNQCNLCTYIDTDGFLL